MQEVFKKIIKKLNDELECYDMRNKTLFDTGEFKTADRIADRMMGVIFSRNVVKQVADEYNNGLIPCSERLPEELKNYNDLEKQGSLRLACKMGDTVWEICKCNDCEYRTFPMKVVDVIPYGGVRWIKGEEPTTWNIYAISDYTDMYKSFYDFGKTVFLTKEEADEALRKMKESEDRK